MEETAATATITKELVLISDALSDRTEILIRIAMTSECYALQFLPHLGRSASTRHFAALQKSTFRPNVLGQRKQLNNTTHKS